MYLFIVETKAGVFIQITVDV